MLSYLEILYDKALESNIHIYNYRLSDTKKAACVAIPEHKTIALDKNALSSTAKETVVLAEEIGHYETCSLYLLKSTCNTPLACLNQMKGEANAKRWAIKNVLPPEVIQKAIDSGCYNNYEMAEYCQVTVEFLRYAFDYYTQQGFEFYCGRNV